MSEISINVKGPSELKLSLKVDPTITVRALKEQIQAEKADFPADSQRLIYSGKVLKDEDTLESYNLKENHTLHMVRSATRSAPSTGNPTSSSNPAAAPSTGSATARGAPTNYATGQNFGSDPLAQLNRADYAGPHMTMNPFADLGINQNDPNMAMNMMQNPQVREQMRAALSRPEVIDQLIASNPQLAAIGPQAREMFRNPEFIDMMTDPETMQRMARLQAMMGGTAGAGMGGLGSLGGAGQQWPPPGTFGQPAAGEGQGQGQGATGTGGAAAANPFAALGGMGGMGGMGGGNMDALRNLLGGAGAGGAAAGGNPFAALGGGGFGEAPRDSRPPEERYANQLEQMQAMGFTDGAANLRALLMSGGSIEAAMGMLFDDPSSGQQNQG